MITHPIPPIRANRRQRDQGEKRAKPRCRFEAHAAARVGARELAQSRVAMAPGLVSRLLVVEDGSQANRAGGVASMMRER